ncbi:CheW domain protein [Vibrio astriarenae]|nr:CheW domain protein [Vibrio sp. C7]
MSDVERLLERLNQQNTQSDIDAVIEDEASDVTFEQHFGKETEPSVDRDVEIQTWNPSLSEPTSEPKVVIEPTVLPESTFVNVEIEECSVEEAQSQQVISLSESTLADQQWQSTERSEEFQVLYFEVNGMTFAVPLDELGGIHKLGELSHLIGRPDWYLGLNTNRDSQYDVVDTARWVMADKLSDDSYKSAYEYIVMLGQSAWGLASSTLKGTEALTPNMVNWRASAGKRLG